MRQLTLQLCLWRGKGCSVASGRGEKGACPFYIQEAVVSQYRFERRGLAIQCSSCSRWHGRGGMCSRCQSLWETHAREGGQRFSWSWGITSTLRAVCTSGDQKGWQLPRRCRGSPEK